MSDKPKARLVLAFSWCCESCGSENFARAVTMEGKSQEERDDAIRRLYGLQEFEPVPEGMGGEFVLAPERVTCSRCSQEFETEQDPA